ncbi:MAG: HAD family hydrolase [Haloferacaceae archaeon]
MAPLTSDAAALPAYDYWLFDLDGTLVDVEDWYVERTFDRVAETLGRRFSERERDVLWHGLGGPRNPVLREWGVDPDEFWPAFHEAEDPKLRAEATYLHDDAAFVGDLTASVGLVTHCQSFLTEPVLDRLDIRDWFDAVVCCTSDLGWKPDPEPVEHARAAIGARGRGVLAGDMPSDVGAAWNAGLDAVHVERHGPRRRGRCVLGDYRVASFDDLTAPRS